MSVLHKTRAIVLRTFRHGDNSVVLKAYTEAFGARSYIVRTGKRSAVRPAHLQPLTLVELVVTERAEREMHHVQEARLEKAYPGTSPDQPRALVLLFAQEVFYRTLREEAPDSALFSGAILLLDEIGTSDKPGNLPLLLLVRMAKHMGILPEPPLPGDDRFDLREGRFFQGRPQHAFCMEPAIAQGFAMVLHTASTGAPLQLGNVVRTDLLDQLLAYFSMHVEGFGQLRSPEVLHALLH